MFAHVFYLGIGCYGSKTGMYVSVPAHWLEVNLRSPRLCIVHSKVPRGNICVS